MTPLPDILDLTQGSNYSFHCLIMLARAGPREVITTAGFARATGASPTYTAKLFKRLALAGLVSSHRGRGGGYSLAKPPDSITLWQVVAALQDGAPLAPHTLPLCSRCSLAAACPLRTALEAAADDIRRRLEAVTVGGLARLVYASDTGRLSGCSSRARKPSWPAKRQSGPEQVKKRR